MGNSKVEPVEACGEQKKPRTHQGVQTFLRHSNELKNETHSHDAVIAKAHASFAAFFQGGIRDTVSVQETRVRLMGA